MKTVTFEQLCAFAAIRETTNPEDVLRNLVAFVVELFPDSGLRTAADLTSIAKEVFGLTLTEPRSQSALDSCVGRGMLARKDGRYVLTQVQRSAVQQKLAESRALESRVRQAWLSEVKELAPDLEGDVAWCVLEGYATKLFRQHGIQTMALVDPLIDIPEDLQASLRIFLDEELKQHCPEELRSILRNLVESFFAGLSANQDRIAFIVQIADSVVSFYALAVRPEVAAQLSVRLQPLTLFLDTNVLFGLIGLDDGHLVDVSHELVDVVEAHNLPLKLRYHEATARELRTTFEAVTSRLIGPTWSPAISRAAAKSSRISTIQRLYHERNAERPLSPQTFFAPYEHMDVLIQERGIKIYRDSGGDRQAVYDLIGEYTAFLEGHGREKKYEAIDHDPR